MTEKTGLPTEAKILQFPAKTEPVPKLTNWGDIHGSSVTTARIDPAPLHNRCIAEVFGELVQKAVLQSKISGIPVYLLVETAVRQNGRLNIHVAKLLGDALKQLRNAHYEQQERLGAVGAGDLGSRREHQAALSGPPLDLDGETSGASSGSPGRPTVDS